MPSIKLQQVKNFEKLLQYLETELGWPVEGREIDDIAFPFDLEADLGLDKKEVAKVRHVYRLKKMHKKQPFGIFFVDFEGKKMPVSVLKRILRTLALRRRANAKAADQLAWDVEDLIFISAVGEEKDASREISFAHFRKEPDNRHVLKVLAWDGGDTPLKMDHLDEVLHENLRFPDDVSDVEAWRKSWTAAFRTGVRQNIRRSEELAQALAALAMRINKEALSLIKKESANGPLKTLHAGFKDALIHDLTEEAFTDCYAQTITYGLLTAAITKVNQAGVKDLTSTSVLEMVPSTNPFLKDILSSFLEAGGRGQKGIDFDDLGVQDVIDLLRAESTDLPNILRDFGNLTQDEDPVIHFYETFLKIYNKDERVKRGAFYTPRPVVSYIVRSVDELLRKEFGLEDGLADTTTWGEMIKRNPAIKLPPLTDSPGEKKTIKETEPFVQILDPATGTATFLVEVINIIEKTVKAKAWAKLKKGLYDHDRHSKHEEVLKAWNEYVPEHLLKRLHAYEIMMAPYVIAHMKVGLKLAETGYRFMTEERARVYLTNALEPAKDFKERLNFDIPALAIEAKQVNDVKRNKRYTVVIGNPPYSGLSANMSDEAKSLVERYKYIEGESINERKLWLQDDYVKFVSYSQQLVEKSGIGLIGMITNHGFIDNPTFRGMRYSLLKTFKQIRILNLRGNSNKKEKAPDGSLDENLFDIRQGVSVMLASGVSGASRVEHKDAWGTRSAKCLWLSSNSSLTTNWDSLSVGGPEYYFVPGPSGDLGGYFTWTPLDSIFPVSGVGMVSARDRLCFDFTQKGIWDRVNEFVKLEPERAREKYDLGGDADSWSVERAQKDITSSGLRRSLVTPILYRPFDVRYTYYTGTSNGFLARPLARTSRHMIDMKNVALCFVRREELPCNFAHVFVTRHAPTFVTLSGKAAGNFAPLYLHVNSGSQDELRLTGESTHNICKVFAGKIARCIGLSARENDYLQVDDSAESIFAYVYATSSSPKFRLKYNDALKLDFPRIPLPGNRELYLRLSEIGKKLISIHLLEKEGEHSQVRVISAEGKLVEKPSWSNDTVWLDKEQTVGFTGIREEAWNFHVGGYQVCSKWLKDRKGMELTKDDIAHYLKVVAAINATIKLTVELDEVIDAHGGWPKAFQ
jgi:hypothetical protein